MRNRLLPMLLAAIPLSFMGCKEEEKDYGADFDANQPRLELDRP
jgi:hypothetical protein